jgi:hypothetical protein
MRIEDIRGNSSNLVSAEGRGPLCFGEREALRMQHRNRSTENMPPGEVEAARLRVNATDMALKAARFSGPAR